MHNVRRLILYLASAIGVWLLVSFGGAMLDSANAAFWSNSLMWSILSFLVTMPALALMNDFSLQTQSSPSASAGSSSPRQEEPSFVEKDTQEVHTLWPEPEQSQHQENWSSQEATEDVWEQGARV